LVVAVPAAGSEPPDVLLKKLCEIWSINPGISLSVGYALGSEIDGLRSVYAESGRSAQRRFYEGEGEYGPLDSVFPSSPQPNPTIKPVNQLLLELRSSSQSRNAEAADAAIAEWMNRWRELRPDPDSVRGEAIEMVTALFVNEQEMTVLLEGFEELKRSETLEELIRLLLAQIRGYRVSLASGSHTFKGNKQLIDKSIAYISANYTSEISLQQLANLVHMSKNYFCLQFKQHTGLNFIDYLIRLRIGKAKELLCNHRFKIYEVAERAGFNDVKYFSKLFKRMTGLSPVDYRERQLEER
jgi:two-component system response regulator YesN